MKKLIYILTSVLPFYGLLTIHFGCNFISPSEFGKPLIGKWCKPSVVIKGLPTENLSSDEKAEYRFMMGGIEKIFEDMCIEYFDDRTSGKDSYQLSIYSSDSTEKQNEFGEYELLANGKRLVLHTAANQRIDIELSKLTETEHQWRLQYGDMIKLSGSPMDLPEELPNFAMYLTFKKEK